MKTGGREKTRSATIAQTLMLGFALLVTSCDMPWDPETIELYYGSNQLAPQEAGIINVRPGTKFIFYSNVGGGFTAVARFQVPEMGSYTAHHGGQPVFTVRLRGPGFGLISEPDPGETVTLSLEADTDYFIDVEQGPNYAMGGTSLVISAN